MFPPEEAGGAQAGSPEALEEDEAELELQKQLEKGRRLRQLQQLRDSGEKVGRPGLGGSGWVLASPGPGSPGTGVPWRPVPVSTAPALRPGASFLLNITSLADP